MFTNNKSTIQYIVSCTKLVFIYITRPKWGKFKRFKEKLHYVIADLAHLHKSVIFSHNLSNMLPHERFTGGWILYDSV